MQLVIAANIGNRTEVVQLDNESTANYDVIHDQTCNYEIPEARNQLDPSHDYAVPEAPLLTSTGGVRDAINLNQCLHMCRLPHHVLLRANSI